MHTTQRTISLRELAREYAGGRIDRQTFRQRRARLLNELASYVHQPSHKHPEIVPDPNPESSSPSADKPKNYKLLIGLAGTLSVLVLAGFIIFMVTQQPASVNEDHPLPSTAITKPPSPTIKLDPQKKGKSSHIEYDPIKEFVIADDWSPENRNRLLLQWDNLSPKERGAASSTTWFLSFSSELRTMIKEEQGLAGGKSSAEVDTLIDFAAHLGLDFSPVNREPAVSSSGGPVEKMPISAEEPAQAELQSAPETHPSTSQNQAATPELDTQAEKASPPVTDQITEDLEPKAPAAEESKTLLNLSSPPVKVEIPEVTTEIIQTDSITMNVRNIETKPENCRPLTTNRKIPKCRDKLKNGKKGPWLRLLPGGQFTKGRNDVKFESPSHKINIAYPIAIGAYEVSYREFSLFCKETGTACPTQPSQDDTFPVVNVSREDAKQYAQWLSMQTGRGYRLPTESEWEYAARAGTHTAYPLPETDLGTYAHFSSRGKKTTPLPRTPQRTNPNHFGIFNMAGNVREWVLDSWTDGYEITPRDGSPYKDEKALFGIVRGGSYADNKNPLHSSARQKLPYKTQDVLTGFRLVRDIYLRTDRDDLARWGDWWLSFQQDEHLTIQLHAVNKLEEARHLIDRNPLLSFKVISSNQSSTGYLILFGLYDSEAAAINAYKSLPDRLKNNGENLIIKSIRELR